MESISDFFLFLYYVEKRIRNVKSVHGLILLLIPLKQSQDSKQGYQSIGKQGYQF